MPRNVRNFWIEMEVDGKKTKIATGPIRKDGGFNLRIRMRDEGEVSNKKGMWISGKVDLAGNITLLASADGTCLDVPVLEVKGKR